MHGTRSQQPGRPARTIPAWLEFDASSKRRPGRLLLALAPLALVVALVSAPAAAAAEKTFNFETPKIEGSDVYGPGLGKYEHEIEPYIAEGLEFSPHVGGLKHPIELGYYPGEEYCGQRLYRDTANAHSGEQVVYSFCEDDATDHYWDGVVGRITTSTEAISVYVGIPQANHTVQTITLTGYGDEGEMIASDSVELPLKVTKVSELLSIHSASANIAYFSVQDPGFESYPLEIDDLHYTVPAKEAPARIALAPVEPKVTGGEGTTVGVPVTVERFNGAEEPIELHVSGLPSGVTVTGGTTIAPGEANTELEFAVAPTAPVGESAIAITATSKGVSTPPADETKFVVAPGLALEPGEHIATVAPCSTKDVNIGNQQLVPGESQLTLSSEGNTEGLQAKLSHSSVAQYESVQLEISRNSGAASGAATYIVTATDGSFPAAQTKVSVERVAGTIFSVSKNVYGSEFGLPITPQFGEGGSLMTITGTGLCGASSVQFGSPRGAAKPISAEPNGSSLVVEVPKYAMSGKVVVQTPAGEVTGPETEIDNFRDTWGFVFKNFGLHPGEINQRIVTELFGAKVADISTESGEVPSPAAIAWLKAEEEVGSGGVCLGISTLIQWFSHQSSLSAVQQALSAFPSELPNKFELRPYRLLAFQEPSAALRAAIALFQANWATEQSWVHQNAELEESTPIPPQRTVDEVSRLLKENDASNLPVIVVFNQGKGGGGHAVIPYNVESDGAGGYYIDIYNSNAPYTYHEPADTTGADHQTEVENSRIHVNATGSWTLADGFSPTWEGDAHHMYVIPEGVVGNPYATNASERPVLPATFDKVAAGSVGSAGALAQVSNEAGHTLINPDGSENVNLSTHIPHATLDFPLTGGSTPAPPTALLPSSGSYTITERGAHTGSYTESLMGAGLDALLSSNTRSGVEDSIGVDAGAGRVSFTAGGSGKPLTIEMVHDPAGSSFHSITLSTTASRGAPDTLTFKGGSVHYTNHGPATTVTLALSNVSANALPTSFSSGPIRLGAGQQATFTPTSWQSLQKVALTVGGHGAGARRTLANRLATHTPVSGLKLGVRAGTGATRLLTIAGHVHSLPAGAQLEFIWVLRRAGKVLERHIITLTGKQLTPGAKSESLAFTAPAAGQYRFTGRVTLIELHGIIEQGSTVARSMTLKVS
jgi:hypothetical protein